MTDSTDAAKPGELPIAKLASLGYDSAAIDESRAARPKWVYLIVTIYLLMLLAVLTLPAWTKALFDINIDIIGTCIVGTMIACGLSLMIIPVKVSRRRPIVRRSLWLPVIATGLLAGALVCGAGLALIELFKAGDAAGWIMISLALLVWAGWAILFMAMERRSSAQSVGMKLHRKLFAGSVLELLIAVPSHVIVRRRDECCAGMDTGLGICVGLVVMVIAMGPGVLILYNSRRKRITPPGAIRF